MLKIKDNVDLKELEKFGMKYNGGSECYIDDYEYEIIVIYEDRKINVDLHQVGFSSLWKGCKEANEKALNIIYDLIKADLVEKVDD